MSFPVPLILEPSGVWAGADGNWSTWSLQVGTPPQQFNVLPSTSHGEVWIPVTEGCSWLPSTIDCGKLRGIGSFQGAQSLGFQDNSSTTWDPIGIYELSVGSDLFNTSESGLYGLDTVSLNDNVSIPEQIVAGIATQDFWLGSMGLNQQSSDFPVLNESASSLLDKMKAQNRTPSVSFSLAVGASYDAFPGSLIVGGFDRNIPQDAGVEVAVSRNHNRSLIANVQSIVATNTPQGTVSLTHELPSLSVAFDSGVSQLWLPRTICDDLASILNLTYDSTTGLYLVSDSARSRLLDLSPEFTFTLSANATSNSTADIIIPYSAFDLSVGIPTYNASTRYFPIRRAPNDNLFVLGRAFLQEAYLVVDWERNNFTIGQAKHERNPNPNITPILPPTKPRNNSPGLSPGIIAGIVVGAVAFLALVAVLAYLLWRRRHPPAQAAEGETSDQKARPTSPFPPDKKEEETTVAELSASDALLAEASSNPVHELHQEQVPFQLMSEPVYELEAERVERELEAKERGKGEGS